MPVRREKWDPAWGPFTEAAMRKRLEAEGYSVSRYTYPPGTYFSEHTHPIDKKDTVIRGRLKITSAGKEFVLEAGDLVEIPAGAPHTAEVLGSETVVSFDATRPPRK